MKLHLHTFQLVIVFLWVFEYFFYSVMMLMTDHELCDVDQCVDREAAYSPGCLRKWCWWWWPISCCPSSTPQPSPTTSACVAPSTHWRKQGWPTTRASSRPAKTRSLPRALGHRSVSSCHIRAVVFMAVLRCCHWPVNIGCLVAMWWNDLWLIHGSITDWFTDGMIAWSVTYWKVWYLSIGWSVSATYWWVCD